MKHLPKVFILSFSFLLILQSALAIVVPIAEPSDSKSKSGSEKGEETVKLLGPDAISFLNLTPRQYYEITGEKMKFKERMALKMAQRQLRKSMRQGNTADALNQGNLKSGKFNLLWFLLGLLTIPIGIILAFTITKDPGARKSALYGAAIGAVIIVFIIAF
jgi:hypothetical protein